MEKKTVRDDFDFFDIADDFIEQPIIILNDELLDEIFAEDQGKNYDNSMEYVGEIVEDDNSEQQSLSFYEEYMNLLGAFAEHYEDIQLQYSGVYSKIKDVNERSKKLMKLAIRDCPTELLGKMVAASVYEKHYYFNSFLDDLYFDETGEKDSRLSTQMFDIGTKFNKLLHFAEDTLIEKQRFERKQFKGYVKNG